MKVALPGVFNFYFIFLKDVLFLITRFFIYLLRFYQNILSFYQVVLLLTNVMIGNVVHTMFHKNLTFLC